jgi:hypothetical protein
MLQFLSSLTASASSLVIFWRQILAGCGRIGFAG